MKFKLIILTLTAFTCQAFSQQKWTLEDCINYATANNLNVKRTELQANIAENNYLQSKISIAPAISGELGRTYRFGRQIDPITNDYSSYNKFNDDFGISANMSVFSGLRNLNNIKMNQYQSLAAVQNVEREKIELTLNIATAYLDILFKKDLDEVNKNQMHVTELQVERTKKLVEAGSLARGDYLEMYSQLSSEKLNVTNAENELNLAYLNLTQLLDLDSTQGFDIVFPDTIDPELYLILNSPLEIYNEALAYLPHIKSAEYNLNSMEYYLATQKGRRSPQVYLSSSWGTGYTSDIPDTLLGYSYGNQLNFNSNTSLRIGVSIPIFNRWDINNSISNARINVDDAQYSFDLVKQQLYKEIQQAYNEAIASHEKYFSASEAVTSYLESFNYTEQKYNVGIVNSVEYSISKNNYIKAESELLRAKYEYIFSVKILDFYRGKALVLQNN